MARTTPEAVAVIVEVDTDAAPDLAPFIALANELVTEVCADAAITPAYSTARLEMIERYLAAHFYVVRDPRVSSETAGPVQASYKFNVGLILQGTKEGQQALLLDTKGGLARLSKALEKGVQKQVSATWLGTKCPPRNDGA